VNALWNYQPPHDRNKVNCRKLPRAQTDTICHQQSINPGRNGGIKQRACRINDTKAGKLRETACEKRQLTNNTFTILPNLVTPEGRSWESRHQMIKVALYSPKRCCHAGLKHTRHTKRFGLRCAFSLTPPLIQEKSQQNGHAQPSQ
jgi:hypothetical protein